MPRPLNTAWVGDPSTQPGTWDSWLLHIYESSLWKLQEDDRHHWVVMRGARLKEQPYMREHGLTDPTWGDWLVSYPDGSGWPCGNIVEMLPIAREGAPVPMSWDVVDVEAIDMRRTQPTPDLLGRYYTDDAAALALVRALPIQPGQLCGDPHCGDGAFIRALNRAHPEARVFAADLDTDAPFWNGLHPGRTDARFVADFLADDWLTQLGEQPDWIIGNPPYAIDPSAHSRFRAVAQETALLHLERAIERARVGVCMLLRHGFWTAVTRYDWILRHLPVQEWKFVPRLAFHGPNLNGGNDSVDYVALVWLREECVLPGDTRTGLLPWKGLDDGH